MRRYGDPVEVRRGLVRAGSGPAQEQGGGVGVLEEGPEQFLWRGRLWQVRSVVAHWVETGAWWQSADAVAVIGSDDPAAVAAEVGGSGVGGDLLSEQEVWRVEARRGPVDPGGVFDLAFCWSRGSWQLVACVD